MSDQLRFGFEAADEVWLVGVLRQDDLDGDFSIDDGLVRSIDCPKSSLANEILDGIASDRLTDECVHKLCPAFQRIGEV